MRWLGQVRTDLSLQRKPVRMRVAPVRLSRAVGTLECEDLRHTRARLSVHCGTLLPLCSDRAGQPVGLSSGHLWHGPVIRNQAGRRAAEEGDRQDWTCDSPREAWKQLTTTVGPSLYESSPTRGGPAKRAVRRWPRGTPK